MRKKLNPEQQKAVDAIEGPTLVIAGPGTGKTEILAARIANILNLTEAKPENILCLTYTDAGAVAMRTRLIEFVGVAAYRVAIYTFHGFCSKVISEQADFFGMEDMAAVSDLDRYHIVREIIDSFPQGHPLLRETGDIYYEANRLLELYSAMKQEGWTVDFLTARTDEYVSGLPTNPD